MDVFRLRLDVNRFQQFLPADQAIWASGALAMDCRPKSHTWKPPSVYVHNPTRTRGNFLHLCSGGLVVDAKAVEALRPILEIAGELLPLPFEGGLFYLLNVMECVNCLDQEHTEWILGETTKERIDIQTYRFHPERFTESAIFKIPETARAEVLTVSGFTDEDQDFRYVVEREGLTGIIFEKLWSDRD